MSIFDITAFERSGFTENDIQLGNNETTCDAINAYSSNALRSIKIFTQDMQRELYDNETFRQTLLNFARGNRHAQIQLLVADSSLALQQGHRLIRLAQQLSSAMQIRNTPEYFQQTPMSFILIDQIDFVFKPDSNTSYALQAHCKHRGNKLEEFFTPAWEQAEIDPQTRRFHI